jgi:hypothetical protein
MRTYRVHIVVTDDNYSFIVKGLVKRCQRFVWEDDNRFEWFFATIKEELEPGGKEYLKEQMLMKYSWLSDTEMSFAICPK